MGRLLNNFADCICCGRGNRYQSADTWMNQPLNIFQPRSTATLEDLLEKSSRAREAVWQQLGSLEPLVLSHLVSPTLSGGPKWPALRQAFRLVRRPNGNVILASDGLSDPFDDITLGGEHHQAHAFPLAIASAVLCAWFGQQPYKKCSRGCIVCSIPKQHHSHHFKPFCACHACTGALCSQKPQTSHTLILCIYPETCCLSTAT